MKNKKELYGLVIVIFCGMIWGIGGVMGQILFQNSEMTPALLSSVRMFLAGTILTTYCIVRKGVASLRILHAGKDTLYFLCFAFVGIMTMQFSYFAAVDASNASTATVLQYTYPIFILLYNVIIYKKRPKGYEYLAVVSALFGVFVIATHCNLHQLNLSPASVGWGMVAAISYVVYTVAPGKIYEKYGLTETVGIGLLISGILLFVLTGSFRARIEITPLVVGITLFITMFSSLIPMVLFGKGVAIVGSMKASLFVTVEPFFCTLISVILGLTILTGMDVIGFLLILIPIEVVAYKGGKENASKG